ncbi:MAG: phosphoadenylyl-sulfate reductase [Blastocatellia bacterium]|nr:phosphoadenylyl-sulfate reductase [Blastocatellia bacterium]
MIAVKQRSVSTADIEVWAERFEGRRVEDLLEWAANRFSPGLVMTSNFGAEGVVLLDHLMRVAPRTPIVYLNTGFQFSATDELKERLRERYDLNLIEAKATLGVEEQAAVHGPQLHARDSDLCCRLRKVEPLRDALQGYSAWIAALRRDQSPTRAKIRPVEWNLKHALLKLHPLAAWTRREVWEYILRHRLPYNRLYDEGYASIGCQPCTRPVAAGAHERSGRWDGARKQECGIHL